MRLTHSPGTDWYPNEFPAAVRSHLLGEEIRAARVFEKAKSRANSDQIGDLLCDYILRLFLAFAGNAAQLVLAGELQWDAVRLNSEAREYLRLVTIYARTERGCAHGWCAVAPMVSHMDGSLLPEVQRKFEKTPGWRKYERILRALPAPSVNSSNPGKPKSVREAAATPGSLHWEDIKIWFISDERVRVDIGRAPATYNYSEMGFEDKRSGKPNQVWTVLRALAKTDGVITQGARRSPEFRGMEKNIERLRKRLRKHFKIELNPIALDASGNYRCRFSIELSTSFES